MTSSAAIRDLLRYAVGYDHGRGIEDPVYKAAVEGRQDRAIGAGQFYSSCGDLPHWLAYRLGVREPWVNRDELRGWEYQGAQNNVTRLWTHPAMAPYNGRQLHTGDVYIIGVEDPLGSKGLGPTHVGVVLDHDPSTGALTTADYGQPGGALQKRPLSYSNGRWLRGTKPFDGVLPIEAILAGASAPLERAADYASRLGLPPPEETTETVLSGLSTSPLLAAVAGFAVGGAAAWAARALLRR